MLTQRLAAFSPYKFSIEIVDPGIARDIARSLAEADGRSMIAIVNTDEVISRVLTRSVVDIAYYKIYYEILSYYGYEMYFEDPKKFGNLAGKSFAELCMGFGKGVLIGRTRVVKGDFAVELGPEGPPLQDGEWLIFIAKDRDSIEWDPSTNYAQDKARTVKESSEIVSKRICMIGDHNDFSAITTFLDEKSKATFERSRILLADSKAYFDRDMIVRLRDEAFDGVIINLEDEIAFRLTLYILSLFGKDDPFLASIITVIENPVSEDLLNRNIKYRNTILSDRLAAKYMTQLLYQKSLEVLVQELMSPVGYEFNLLTVDKEIPRSFLTDKKSAKEILLASGMIYVGTVDMAHNIQFDNDQFAIAHQVIVLAKGER